MNEYYSSAWETHFLDTPIGNCTKKTIMKMTRKNKFELQVIYYGLGQSLLKTVCAILVILVYGCSLPMTSQRSKQDMDASQSSTQGLSHQDASNESTIPIIINCIQVFSSERNVEFSPCLHRDGTGGPSFK